MKKSSEIKIQNSRLNPVLRTPNSGLKKRVALLWDESFLWGLMAYKTMKAEGLSFELIRAEDIKKGCLENYALLFVPGGWASNKLKPLGDKGINEIKKFVRNGGNYLGFCGGAGLATLDGIGLLNIKRKPTKERVPSFSGRIYLTINKHPMWDGCRIQDAGFKIQDNHASENSSLVTRNSSPVFHAWWPSQFLIEDSGLEILATYGNALPDSFSSDLNVGDVEMNSNWTELEEIYGINLNPKRLKDEPAVIEGAFGKGRVILSLIHFDTPDDAKGAMVLKNLWEYLNTGCRIQDKKIHASGIMHHASEGSELITELESAVDGLISLGIRNFLWFWRNPMLLQWRRGVRGLEYCTLHIMIKEIARILKMQDTGCRMQDTEKHLKKIKGMLMPFAGKAKHLLILERYALRNGHLTYERCDDPEIREIRTELFGDSKSHSGLFKELIDETDKLLYALMKTEVTR
ncbi:MAG: BPL-N domain-containing protein [Nitrospirae bacterium]|nr:BPL-N domain-containing protein [Nitrospirota bacterium]